MTSTQLKQSFSTVSGKIRKLELDHNLGPDTVRLIAVSKTRTINEILTLVRLGQKDFGENYVQEALDKMTGLADEDITWHFIGPIQKNKTKLIAQHFDWVHSVDREIIASRLNEQRPGNMPPLNICIQVNIDNEESKFGIDSNDLLTLAEQIRALPNLNLRGLMTIPSAKHDYSEQCRTFSKMRDLLALLQQQGYDVDTLSMGMTNDYEAAIASGSTMVRIGTAIFGPRNNSN